MPFYKVENGLPVHFPHDIYLDFKMGNFIFSKDDKRKKINYAHAWEDPAALRKDTEKVLQSHCVRKYFLFVFGFVF